MKSLRPLPIKKPRPKPSPSHNRWALIESEDRIVHIVPITLVQGFGTERQAWDFLVRMDALGNPVLTDDEDNVTATYIGHTLTSDCSCCPTPGESDPGVLTHHLFQ